MRALVVLVLLPLLLPAARAESPGHGACDATGALVCAGMDLGANVQCAIALDASAASCSWTYGWLTQAYSPALLPGHESHVIDATVRVCSSVSGCADTPFPHAGACDFVGLVDCTDSQQGPAGGVTRPLALGECLTVTVTIAGSIDASVAQGIATIATTHFESTGNGSVDNGR
jgi:hypothetical protein